MKQIKFAYVTTAYPWCWSGRDDTILGTWYLPDVRQYMRNIVWIIVGGSNQPITGKYPVTHEREANCTDG